jgi:hypothetical protein
MPCLDVEKVGNVDLSRLPAPFSASRKQNFKCFLKCRIFAKFRPEKYDFELCLVEKMAKIDRISKKKISKSPIF